MGSIRWHWIWHWMGIPVGFTSMLGLLAATGAAAATLPFEGTLALTVRLVSLDTTLSIDGGGTAVVNGSGGGLHLESLGVPAGVFAGNDATGIPYSSVAPIHGMLLTAANGAGVFSAISGGPPGGGAMPIHGTMKICLFGPCSSATANINVPLSAVGTGGFTHITGSVTLTVIGAPWTLGTASVGGLTAMGYAHGPASLASSTAQPSGAVRLVTPVMISTNISQSPIIPSVATLTLHFVPEPGTLVLLGGGIAGLVLGGRRRSTR